MTTRGEDLVLRIQETRALAELEEDAVIRAAIQRLLDRVEQAVDAPDARAAFHVALLAMRGRR